MINLINNKESMIEFVKIDYLPKAIELDDWFTHGSFDIHIQDNYITIWREQPEPWDYLHHHVHYKVKEND